jgi:hypothetical protein
MKFTTNLCMVLMSITPIFGHPGVNDVFLYLFENLALRKIKETD